MGRSACFSHSLAVASEIFLRKPATVGSYPARPLGSVRVPQWIDPPPIVFGEGLPCEVARGRSLAKSESRLPDTKGRAQQPCWGLAAHGVAPVGLGG